MGDTNMTLREVLLRVGDSGKKFQRKSKRITLRLETVRGGHRNIINSHSKTEYSITYYDAIAQDWELFISIDDIIDREVEDIVNKIDGVNIDHLVDTLTVSMRNIAKFVKENPDSI